MTQLTPGSRLKSAVCETEAVIVKPPRQGQPACGGAPMIAFAADRPTSMDIDPQFATGSLVGKRYSDAESGLEMLCTKAGAGSLSIEGRPLDLRETKQLPSSD